LSRARPGPTSVTAMATVPSANRTASPGFRSFGSSRWEQVSSRALSDERSLTRLNSAPRGQSTRSPGITPSRIFGPHRSCKTPTCRSKGRLSDRISARTAACSSCVPCEKLSRKTLTPASISCRNAAGLREAGPIVATILVRGRRGVKAGDRHLRAPL
jgi:hypothetical protein